MTKGNIGKRREAVTGGHATGGCCDAHQKPRSHDTSRIAWAKLMARVGRSFRRRIDELPVIDLHSL